MPKDNLLSGINAYYAGLPAQHRGRDPMSIEAQIAQAELQEHRTHNPAITAYYDGLPEIDDPEAAAAAILNTIKEQLEEIQQAANTGKP